LNDQRALQPKPSERRALIEPERARQGAQAPIAHVQRDHLFIQPQGPRPGPLVDQGHRTDQGDHRRRRKFPAVAVPGLTALLHADILREEET
jgi:hypothetical protein